MKGLFAFAGVIGLMFAYTAGDRVWGGRVREYFDKNERWLFPASFAGFWGSMALIGMFLPFDKSELGFTIAFRALIVLGLNIVVGYAGLLDLGYIAFFAIGAYTMAILLNVGPAMVPWDLNFWQILPFGIVIALFAGMLLGAPTLRLRGDYLAIVTLGFGEIVRILAQNLEGITNGAKGITGVPPVSVAGHPLLTGNPRPYFLFAIAAIAIATLLIRGLNNSRVGRAWAAIREDEVAAEAMGVPTLKYKLWAFAIGASVASMGGMLFAPKIGFVSPESFQLVESIFILAAVVLGGIGSTAGAMVGAVGIYFVPELLRTLNISFFEDMRYGIFGLVLVLMMIFRPQGVVPSRRRAAELKGGTRETHGASGDMPIAALTADEEPTDDPA